MGKNPEVASTGKVTSYIPHQGGSGAQLNPEGGTLQAAPPEGAPITILVQPVEIKYESLGGSSRHQHTGWE